MRRFIVLAENTGYVPADGRKIIEKLRTQGHKVVDVRVATKHLEIDIQNDSPPTLHGFIVHEVVEVGEKTVLNPEEEFRRAVYLFNRERFWEAHETLEPLWRTSKGAEKQILHALILTAAAYVHLQKNDRKGFHSIIKRALKNLLTDHKVYRGIDLDDLRYKIKHAMESENFFEIRVWNDD
ncbi:MAG: DUF309 domain-containing protein [Candidatus Caldarchaeum sp.]|nr:DUF309 domain-containing protein [Candidatus Caldarchaeum sp.]